VGDRARRGLAAAVGAVALCASCMTALAVDPVGAQEFRNGEAEAAAQTFGLNVTQGNANIGFTYGSTIANYRDTTGTADAKALDLGVLSTLFGVEQCDGSAPLLNPATFPPPTRTDSTEAAAPNSRRAQAYLPGMGTAGPGPLAGHQDATATALPSSRAVTESERADMYVLAVDGGSTEVTTKLEGGVREARAVVTARSLTVFGGLFTFVNPRWEAIARSGGTTTAEGSFGFERATVLGIDRSEADATRDLAEFRKGLESLLAPFGVKLRLPEVVIADGRVEVTPMQFAIDDMPWGAQVVAPFLGSIQPLREDFARQKLDEDCKNESSLLMLDVVLGVLAGSGSVEITAGGVEVFTADTDFSSPPLEILPLDAAAPMAAPPEVLGFDSLGADLSLDSFDGAPVDSFDTSTEEVAAEVPEDDSDDERELAAVTASVPSFEDTSAGAAAVAVGTVALLAAVGLSVAERVRARRMTRRIP
jgi:hypothetical protein